MLTVLILLGCLAIGFALYSVYKLGTIMGELRKNNKVTAEAAELRKNYDALVERYSKHLQNWESLIVEKIRLKRENQTQKESLLSNQKVFDDLGAVISDLNKQNEHLDAEILSYKESIDAKNKRIEELGDAFRTAYAKGRVEVIKEMGEKSGLAFATILPEEAIGFEDEVKTVPVGEAA